MNVGVRLLQRALQPQLHGMCQARVDLWQYTERQLVFAGNWQVAFSEVAQQRLKITKNGTWAAFPNNEILQYLLVLR